MSGIKLKHPVTVGDTVVEIITLVRPKIKHLKMMDAVDGEIEKAEALLIALSGESPAVIANIDAEDFAVLSEELGGFFGGVLPTGGT